MMDIAYNYHWRTSYSRAGMAPHSLDWAHQPAVFKRYPEVTPLPLPETSKTDLDNKSLLDIYVSGSEQTLSTTGPPEIPSLLQLSQILSLACGLTAKARQPGGDFYFRSAPSAGALYPNEVYLVWPEPSDLSTGVYHFDALNHQLIPLRCDQSISIAIRRVFDRCATPAPFFVVSGIFFRSAWKYRDRAYRYVLLDAGHLLENLRLAIVSTRYAASFELAFNDTALEQMLGVDPDREGIVGCVSFFKKISSAENPLPDSGTMSLPGTSTMLDKLPQLPPAITEASQVSSREISYEAILNVHGAGRDPAGHDLVAPGHSPQLGLTIKKWLSLKTLPPSETIHSAPVNNYTSSVLHRRSQRNFIPQAMTGHQLACLLELLCLTFSLSDNVSSSYATALSCGCLVNQVDGLKPGYYLLDWYEHRLGQVFEGNRHKEMATICLDQSWLANAAVHFVLMGNLTEGNQRWGDRGYRYTMISAGRLGQAIYLGATALGLGCCGIGAFYDLEAQKLLGLNDDSAMLYLLAAGPIR